ncbi:hypothetical protein [Chryseobacterium sp. SIMBA_028]|uniref:hypothetical protein n=1 Tax=Chryseobacterium sp. SIMBA_028 TaxID=3085771 RepID=UPI00397D03E0
MKKNLVYGLLLLGMLTVSLNSCRTDEMLTSTEQTQKEKIAFFERFEKERSLSKNAASNNYALPFGNSMLAYFEKYPKKKTELETKYGTVDLRVSSQDIGGDEGDNRKLLFFPMLKDGKVTGVIAGVINAERDYLYFDVHQNTHPDVFYLINTFQDYYDSKTVSRNSNNPIDVGEVIIRVTRPVRLTMYDGWAGNGGPGNGGHDMGGGPGDYGSGEGGGSSGSSNPNAPSTPDPCGQMKDLKNKSEYAKNTKYLESKTGNTTESGFRVGDPVSGQTGTQFQELSNKLGTQELDFKIFGSTYGIMHSHYDTLISIFSPDDVNLFIQLLKNAKANGIPVNKVFVSVVTSNGTYQLRGDNIDPDKLTMYTPKQIENLTEIYSRAMGNPNISREALQKEFLKFMETSMKIEGAKVYEQDSDGNTSEVKKDGPKVDCPK